MYKNESYYVVAVKQIDMMIITNGKLK